MGLFDRLSRFIRADLNALMAIAEDPVKILEETVLDMEEDLIQLRQVIVQAMVSKAGTEQKYNQNNNQAADYVRLAELALQKGDKDLAREALSRRNSFAAIVAQLKVHLDAQTIQIEQLKLTLIAMEGKLTEAKTRKTMLTDRTAITKFEEKDTWTTFEPMEQKVLDDEAYMQAVRDLAKYNLEAQVANWEAGNDVEDELEAMEARLPGPATSSMAALP